MNKMKLETRENGPQAVTIRAAKMFDDRFDIREAKKGIIEMWTTPEDKLGFGYTTAQLVKTNSFEVEVYHLVLDGEGTDIMYAIFQASDDVALEPVHWHE